MLLVSPLFGTVLGCETFALMMDLPVTVFFLVSDIVLSRLSGLSLSANVSF